MKIRACRLTRRLQRALVKPESFWRKGLPLPGKADPVSRRDLLFYSDAKRNRGYLGLEAQAKADAEAQHAAAEIVANEPQSAPSV